jgi:hypothetical protein
METFRVSGDQIVERLFLWERMFALNPITGLPFTLDLPARSNLDVTLVTFKPLARGRFATDAFPAIMRVASGKVTFSLSRSSSSSALVLDSSFNGSAESPEQVLPGKTRRLGVGEVLIVPPNATYSVLNLWDVPASAVSVTVMGLSAAPPDQNTSAQSQQFGVTTRTLLTLPTDSLTETTQLRYGTATMMPGSRLAIDSATRLMVLWTESETLATTARRSTCGEGSPTSIPPSDDEPDLTGLYLICPDGSNRHAVFNAGTEPATLWVVSITPKPDAR